MPTVHCCLEEFATELRRRSKQDAKNASGDSCSLSEREKVDVLNRLALSLAREKEMWLPYTEAMSLGVPAPSGVENDVYFDVSTCTMVKINNLLTSHTVLALLDRFLIHNSLFPQTQYTLVGFTGVGGDSIYPVFRQDYVSNATYATHGEILDYMEALGFSACGEAAFTNGNLTITDLRPRNVLKNPMGELFVVDADYICTE